MTQSEQNLDELYFVAGRLDGSDEDDMKVIRSDQGLGHAKQVFKNWLLESHARNHDWASADYYDENGMVYITCARPLTSMMADPLTESDLEEFRYTDPEDDDEQLPGW